MKVNNVLVLIYSHPELYPPTLNAINILSEKSNKVTVVGLSTTQTKGAYPQNVKTELVKTKNSSLKFLVFLYKYFKHLIFKKYKLIVFYDPIPLILLNISYPIIKTKNIKIWYHNHDVLENYKSSKLMQLAEKTETKSIAKLHYFTVPAKERFQYFNLSKFKGKKFVIPNYPSKKLYHHFSPNKKTNILKLIYQGSLGEGHGFEEIIKYIGTNTDNDDIEMNLVGKINENYKLLLEKLILKYKTEEKVKILNSVSYINLQNTTSKNNVGLAIHLPYNITYSTGGTASNKIFEYIACGLPVLLLDSTHYREYFEKYDWAFFTDLSAESLNKIFTEISNNLENLSISARKSFLEEFNFEEKPAKIIYEIIENG